MAAMYGDPEVVERDNMRFASLLLVCLLCLAVTLILYHGIESFIRYLRMIVCLNDPAQKYFSRPTPWFSFLKRHLLYAPLFRKRHSREVRLTRYLPVGLLPSRLQTLLLTGILAMNLAFALTGIEFKEGATVNMLTHFRNRTGTLAVAQMIPLFIMAGRNNPLIPLTGISFDTWNLMHRWFGRIVAGHAITHMVLHTIKSVKFSNWASFAMSLQKPGAPQTGFIVRGLPVSHCYC